MKFSAAVRDFSKKFEQNADEVVRQATARVAAKVITETPVDQGAARKNWQFSVGEPATGTVEGFDPSGQATLAAVLAAIGRTGAGGVTYLSNNLPYIVRLENGWSQQAPNGFVGIAATEFPDYVRSAVSELK